MDSFVKGALEVIESGSVKSVAVGYPSCCEHPHIRCSGHHEIRRRGANRDLRPLKAIVVIGFAAPRTEPLIMILIVQVQHLVGELNLLGLYPVSIKLPIVFPSRPNNTRHAICQCDSRLIVATLILTFKGPAS